VQLALRLAEAGYGEDRRHGGPGHFLPTGRNQAVQELVQPQQPPQPTRQPHVAEVPQAFQGHALQTHQNRLLLVGRVVIVGRIEQRTLRPMLAR
jgi:hypothetical protein